MEFKDINPLISQAVGILEKEEVPSVVLTVDIKASNMHLSCTGKDNFCYIGAALEETFCAVKRDDPDVTTSQKALVRMIFYSLVRSYSKEELDRRLGAWRRSIESNNDFDGI